MGDNFVWHKFPDQVRQWNGTTKDLKPEVRLVDQNGTYWLWTDRLGTDIVKIYDAMVSEVILPKDWFPLNVPVKVVFNCNIHDMIGVKKMVRFYSDGYVTRTE